MIPCHDQPDSTNQDFFNMSSFEGLRKEENGGILPIFMKDRKKGTGYFLGFTGLYGPFVFLVQHKRGSTVLHVIFSLPDFIFKSILDERAKKVNQITKIYLAPETL